MTATAQNLPMPGSSDSNGGRIDSAYAPGTGSTPLRAGTASTVHEAGVGYITIAPLLVELGGTGYVSVTASSAAAVKTSAGRVCKVVVLTAVTTAVSIYDNTNAASGNILLTIPTTAAVGTVYDLYAPTLKGCYVGGASGTPALYVSYL